MINQDYDYVKRRWREWWKRENEDRPLVSVVAPKNGKIFPEKYENDVAGRWQDIEYVVEREKFYCENTYYGGESFPMFNPNLGPDIYGAILGDCDIEFAEQTSWSKHLEKPELEDCPPFAFDENNRWWKKIKAMTEYAVEKADGGYYIKNFDQTYVSLVESGDYTNLKPAEETPFVWTFSGTKDAVVATGTEITVPMAFKMYYSTPEFTAEEGATKPMFIYVNNETSGVESTMAGGVAVAGVDGAIAVAADEAVSVAVYTAAGQLAVSTEVAAGTTELSVAPGFYIVKAGDVVKKVIVK